MKLAYTIWTWGLESEKNFETAVKEVKEAGYNYFENFIGLADMYNNRIEEFKAINRKYGMEFVCIYDYIKDIDEDHTEKAKKYAAFLKENNARFMNIQAPKRPAGSPSEEQLDRLCAMYNEIGKIVKTYGVDLCLHPHFETMIEQKHEIDYAAGRLDPEYVNFCFDTAHTMLGGMDPVCMFKRYAHRIKYIHLKDAKKCSDIEEFRKLWKNPPEGFLAFYELGEADVDFRGVIDVMKSTGYEGFLTVELDHTRYTNKQSAVMSRNYLKEKIKL
jgi:inosose dehydratase